jgi:tetratricopeptide (TPR) repeat protein
MHISYNLRKILMVIVLVSFCYPVYAMTASDYIIEGNSLFAKGDYQNALESYNKSIALDSENDAAWAAQGNAFYSLQNNENAYESYKMATKLNSNNALAWNGIGNALTNLKRYNEAVEAYDRAIDIAPDSKNPYNGKGNALQGLYKYSEALDAYNQSISKDPKYSSPWNGRGAVLYQLSRYCEAVESYQKALELNPNNEAAKNNLLKAKEKCVVSPTQAGIIENSQSQASVPESADNKPFDSNNEDGSSIIPGISDVPIMMVYSLITSFLIIGALVVSYSRIKQE